MPGMKGRRRRVIGAREESSSITSQVAPPPFPPTETNDEATPSQPQSLIDSQNLLIADGQFNQIRGHYTNIVLNVNPTSDNTLTIQGPPSLAGPVPSNETDHTRPPPSSESTQPNHGRTSPRTEANQTIPTQISNDIYERHLILKGRGFPLWIPGPKRSLHLDYRRTGVRIGDVGIITPDGGFSFLFNICLPHDHPVNPRILPEHFAPISPPIEATDIDDFEVFTNYSHLASASSSLSTAISGTGSVFESSASEGAILIMPRGAKSENLGDYERFMEYATANVTEWYKFVNGRRGRKAKNGDVRLVVGSDKTSSWGIATFVNQTQQNSCRLKFCPSEGDSASPYTWSEYSGATDVRAGPNSNVSRELRIDSDPPDFQIENQCLFVRTLNITLTDDVWADIHSTLGSVHVDPRHVGDHSASNHPQSSSPTGGSNPSTSPGVHYGTQRATTSNYGLENVDLASDNNPGMFISGPPERLTAHPSKVLNDMLLAKVPTAKMAITHDDDWSSVITQYDSTLTDPYYNLSDIAANILASRKICEENGVIFLHPNGITNDEIPNETPPGTSPPIGNLISPMSLNEVAKDDVHKDMKNIMQILAETERSATLWPGSSDTVVQQMPSKPEIFHGRDNIIRVGGVTQTVTQLLTSTREETSRACLPGPFPSNTSYAPELGGKYPQSTFFPHPLLESSALNWNMMEHPSSIRYNNERLSSQLLVDMATTPPLPAFSITSIHLPWVIRIRASKGVNVTLEDFFDSIYRALRTGITASEFNLLPHQQDKERAIHAYEQRYRRFRNISAYDKEKRSGMKRIDFLMGRTGFHSISHTGHRSDEWRLNVS